MTVFFLRGRSYQSFMTVRVNSITVRCKNNHSIKSMQIKRNESVRDTGFCALLCQAFATSFILSARDYKGQRRLRSAKPAPLTFPVTYNNDLVLVHSYFQLLFAPPFQIPALFHRDCHRVARTPGYLCKAPDVTFFNFSE